jgi:PadR family transcriptional regulator, regulatory protein PadR
VSDSDKPSGLVQGTLEMLILRSLVLEPMHGYGIGVRLEQISRGAIRVNAGSLFPAFRRLEREGEVKPEWRVTENGRRAKYYALTTRGKATLAKATKEWQSQTRAISRVLNASLAKVS